MAAALAPVQPDSMALQAVVFTLMSNSDNAKRRSSSSQGSSNSSNKGRSGNCGSSSGRSRSGRGTSRCLKELPALAVGL